MSLFVVDLARLAKIFIYTYANPFFKVGLSNIQQSTGE